MSRTTSAGQATVRLLCETFGVSRQDCSAAHSPPVRQQGIRVGCNRVWLLMRAYGLVLARDREPGETRRGHVAVAELNRRFATDLATVWTKQDDVVAIVPTIECVCRSILGIGVTKDQHSPAVLRSADQALAAAFCAPDAVPDGAELRTDHGRQYTGSDCEALVDRWGLEHRFAPGGRVTGNAVEERVTRTLKEEVIWLGDWANEVELSQAVALGVNRYNDERHHHALGFATPSEYRGATLGRQAGTSAAAAWGGQSGDPQVVPSALRRQAANLRRRGALGAAGGVSKNRSYANYPTPACLSVLTGAGILQRRTRLRRRGNSRSAAQLMRARQTENL